MPQSVKFIAFVFCLLTGGSVFLIFLLPSRTAPLRGTAIHRETTYEPREAPVMVEIQLAAGIVGALVMLVDALRREYESPKALPIALAVMGLISFGGTSALYYLIWGWKPTKLPTALRASGLCERCIETTLDKAAPGTATHNLIGTCLIGAADRCPSCGSTVRTVWIMFIFPIVPFASYRVLTLGRASFIRANYIGRRLPQLQWGQIWPVLAITWSVLACFLAAALR